jgi:hypothetical protein
MAVWVMRVWEEQTPKGEEPVEWILVTSVPTSPLEHAWERVEWSRHRWLVEDYHLLAVMATRSGQAPATMTIGSDFGRKSHAWVAIWLVPMMVLLDGEPFGKAGSRCNRSCKAFTVRFISVCKLWVRIRPQGRGLLAASC